jgi:hypothetical protein
MRLSPPLPASLRALTGIAFLVAMIAVQSAQMLPAYAASPNLPSTRQSVSAPPIKDCTRFNGRFGYYANQWCTPAEQARWDKWEVQRLKAR